MANLHAVFPQVESFQRPRSAPEALELFLAGGAGTRYVGGGTQLTAAKDPTIRHLVDLSGAGLSYIQLAGQACAIGATTSLADVATSAVIREMAGGVLAEAIGDLGSIQYRHRATLGGSLASGVRNLEILTPLVALEATLVLAAGDGTRHIPLGGPERLVEFRDLLDCGGLLVEIAIPLQPALSGETAWWSYQKLSRTQHDRSLVDVVAGVQMGDDGKVRFARLAVSGVRLPSAESLLLGSRLNQVIFGRVSDEVRHAWLPRSDYRASAEYRSEMGGVLAERALRQCAMKGGWLS